MASNSQAAHFNTSPPRQSIHCSQPQKMLEFRLKISKTLTTLCQSNGRETIIDMVKTALANTQSKKNTEYMMFKSSKGYYVNLGKPTGALNPDVEYECIFKDKLKEKTVDSIRDYCVQEFEEEWDLKSFYLKLGQNRKTQPPIGNITRIADVIQVDFFPEETLFEALGRDNRLIVSSKDELLLRKWHLKLNDGTEVPLRNKAESCEGKYFELYKNKNSDPDPTLPECTHILPLSKPTQSTLDLIKREDGTHNLVPLSVTPVRQGKLGRRGEVIDHDASYTKRTYKLCSDADLQGYIATKLRFKVKKEEEAKSEKARNTIIKKVFKTYDNFVSMYKFHFDTDDLEAVSDTVGAVVAEVTHDTMGINIGTCFRIGTEFIITNKHVIQKLQDLKCQVKSIHIEFISKGGVTKFNVLKDPFCSSSELDYAIFRLIHSSTNELPGSLTSCGYCIPPLNQVVDPGNIFTLVGYDGNSNKATYITCPIANPGNLDKRIILSLSRRNVKYFAHNNNVENSTCSHGLSGSPCLLRNEKRLVGLYCRGVHLWDSGDSVVEQAVLMSAIVEDVREKIAKGVSLTNITLKEIFYS